MQRLPAFDGDRDGPFERVVFELVMAGAVPVEIAPDVFRARLEGGRRVGVTRFGPDLEARLRAARAGMWRSGGFLVLVGGAPGARSQVLAAAPSFVVGAPVEALHLDEDGAVAGDALQLRRDRVPDWDAFWALVAKPLTTIPASPAQSALSVTIGALIVAMFVVELVYRYADLTPVLNRLGALIPSRVLAGEVWRLGSSMFLHAGPMHIGVNLLALSSLGPGTERLLGRWRFALLYALAGIGGGIAATFAQRAPAVGASGALWGLMTAELVLLWRVRDRLPPEIWKRLRSRALGGLALNLFISTLPGIAWSAHLGGGLTGALVALAYGRSNETVAVRWPLRAAAIAACALVVLGALYGALGTDVGLLTRPPAYARSDLGWGTAELPAGLSRHGVSFGDILIDPGTIVVSPAAMGNAGWKDYDDDGEATDGEVSLRRYRRNGARIAVARKAGDAASPTVFVVWWEKGPWDASIATHVLRSIERRW